MVYRIDDVTAVSALPALPTDNIGEPGFFTGGSTTGQSPTRVRFWWLNMVQEELINIAQAAGIVFDKTKNDQCITAIKQLISGVASSAVMGTPGVLADGDVAGKLLYYAANQKAPVFVYGTTTVALVTTTALGTVLQGFLPVSGGTVPGAVVFAGANTHGGAETFNGVLNSKSILNLSAAEDGDTCLFVTGNYIVNFGQATIWVRDATDFGSTQPINARTAESRYVKSVPAADQTRITSLVGNADGRAVFEDGTNAPVLANLADLPLSDPTQKIQAFSVVTPHQSSGPLRIAFPRAFAPGTVPVVVLMGNQEGDSGGYARAYNFTNVTPLTNTPDVDNEGFSIDQTYLVSNNINWSSASGTLHVIAVGVF